MNEIMDVWINVVYAWIRERKSLYADGYTHGPVKSKDYWADE